MKRKYDWIDFLLIAPIVIGILAQISLLIYIFLVEDSEVYLKLFECIAGGGTIFYGKKAFDKIIERRIESGAYDVEEHFGDRMDLTPGWTQYYRARQNSISRSSVRDYPLSAILDCLKFIENTLKTTDRTARFEVSIFTNRQHPEIYCFWDSYGNNVASSKNEREKNPDYYVEKGYEVVEVLRKPTYHLQMLSSIDESNYNFVNKRQKKQVKSQLMYCFDVETPYVLVITCNKKNAFREKDSGLCEFISLCGNILNSEILIKKKLCCVNQKEFACMKN